ncbi:MAG: hypothetical protein MUF49_09315 [Oculatellaceae cyanobacterium Prado106]|jgi:hypothetical protein|nr:hypothetical protein [Oculatellaceae cyanobacterium Prado106]
MEAPTLDETLLHNRDYTLILAKTAIDHALRPPGFSKRWVAAQKAILTLMQTCEKFDSDGLTLYLSCCGTQGKGLFKQYRHVTSSYLEPILQSNFPPERVELEEVLQMALDDYFGRKAIGKTKPNGEMILVLLDGEPSDRPAMIKTIKAATQQMQTDEELGIGLIQIGEDAIARGFLSMLDKDLQASGAKFDIVHYKQLEAIEFNSLTEFLLNVLND